MRNESMNPSAEWSPYKPNFFHHLTSYRNRTSNLIITLDSFFASIHIQIGPLIVVIFWMKANHKLRTSRNLTAQLKVQQEWALRCTCSSPPKPAHMDCSSVYLQTAQLAGKNLIFTPKKLAKLLFTRQQSQDWWLTSWKQFGNANLEKIAHPGKTPKKKKTEISAHPLWIAIRASKHQGQNWVEWSHRLLRAWSSWPYPARVPQENVVQDILAPQFVQPHLIKHYLGESIKDHANHFVMYLLPNGLSAILTYNVRNVQQQVVAYLDKLVLLGYVWVGKRDDR